MIHPIEKDGRKLLFNPSFGYLRDEDFSTLPMGQTVSLCAWHDDAGYLGEQLKRAGYVVSHGICHACKTNFENGKTA